MADPYNIYTYLTPYMSSDPEILAQWYAKWGMYLTPFDSREIDRLNELTNYTIEDELRKGMEVNQKVDIGIGKSGFAGSYMNSTNALADE